MSQEYTASIILIIGAGLKMFGIEFESQALEGLIGGLLALWIAIRRYKQGDITLVGSRKS